MKTKKLARKKDNARTSYQVFSCKAINERLSESEEFFNKILKKFEMRKENFRIWGGNKSNYKKLQSWISAEIERLEKRRVYLRPKIHNSLKSWKEYSEVLTKLSDLAYLQFQSAVSRPLNQ